MAEASRPLWMEVLGQSLLGRRGVAKTANLWLPLAVLVVAKPVPGGPSDTIACGWILLAVFCWSQACILGNDISDTQDDGASGKRRWIARLPSPANYLVVILLSGVGACSAYLAAKEPAGPVAFVAALALGLFYSFRPVRLKERGALGLCAYSFSATLAFVVMPWAVLGYAGWHTLAVLAAAVFFDKWTNIHFHQLVDYEADHISNTQTYAVVAGETRARKTVKWAAGAAVLSLIGVLALMIVMQPDGWLYNGLICAIVAALIGVYARIVRRRGNPSSLFRELPGLYLAWTYAVLRVLPLLLFASLAMAAPIMWFVFALVACVLAGESLYSFRYRYD